MKKIQETQNKIVTSDKFVLSETAKIQYSYGLKHVIRYVVEREEEIGTESVAEHVYALHLLADYFLPLEDSEQKMDWSKIHDMLQYHDIDEIETGDIIGYLKTESQKAEEAKAMERVILRFPEHLQGKIQKVIREYDEQITSEAKFAKALDRIEPLFQIFNQNGKKILKLQNTTRKQSWEHKEPYLKSYKYLFRFLTVIEETMENEGYFSQS